jgi:hypothetical protein
MWCDVLYFVQIPIWITWTKKPSNSMKLPFAQKPLVLKTQLGIKMKSN